MNLLAVALTPEVRQTHKHRLITEHALHLGGNEKRLCKDGSKNSKQGDLDFRVDWLKKVSGTFYE